MIEKIMDNKFYDEIQILQKEKRYTMQKIKLQKEINELKMEEKYKEMKDSLLKKYDKAQKLKDYALSLNLNISDDTIEKIHGSKENNEVNENNLDIALRDLTSVTYPTTIDTIESDNKPSKLFIVLTISITALALVLAVISTSVGDLNILETLRKSITSICLGFLGASVYVFFNIIGIMKARAFESNADYENFLRLFLGAVLGWLMFYIFTDSTSVTNSAAATKGSTDYLFSLLPFLAGFSTRLVFGILNQSIKAIEIALGIEGTSSNILRRKKR